MNIDDDQTPKPLEGPDSDGHPPEHNVDEAETMLFPGSPIPRPPKSIAECAAEFLLQRQFKNLPPPIHENELVVVDVMAPEWVAATVAIAAEAFSAYRANSAQVPAQAPAKKRSRTPERRVYVLEKGDKPAFADQQLPEVIGKYLKTGLSVIIVTAEAELILPQMIRTAADHIVTLPLFDAKSFEEFLSAFTKTESFKIPPTIDFSQIMPHHLHVAWRSNNTVDVYVEWLARVLRSTIAAKSTAAITLDNLHGMDEVVGWGKALAADLAAFRNGKIQWSDIDRGALLVGPPGCGKTIAAAAIAQHCGVEYFPTSYSEWQSAGEGHLGDVTKAIRTIFQKARNAVPSILFIDELDAVNSRGNSKNHPEWWRAIITALLTEMDGSASREGLIIIGATNFLDNIDPALRRAGRLDREIQLRLPSRSALKNIYQYYLQGALDDDDLERVANFSVNRTGADVSQIVRGARRRARTAKRDVTFEDVVLEIAGALPDPDDELTKRVAIHEAGHAVILTLQNPDRPPALMLGAAGRNSGLTRQDSSKPEAMTSAVIDALLEVILAGRAAEEVICGHVSGGAGGDIQSDLAKVTILACAAECQFGLGSNGIMWSEMNDLTQIPAELSARPEIAAAIQNRIDRAYARSKEKISKHRITVENLAAALLSRIVLSSVDVGEIVEWSLSKEASGEETVSLLDTSSKTKTVLQR